MTSGRVGQDGRPARNSQRLLDVRGRDTTVDLVIVHKVDRLARNRADDVAINLAMVVRRRKLVSVSENIDETPFGLLLHGIMSSIAEFYSRNLAAEAMKGATQKAQPRRDSGEGTDRLPQRARLDNGHENRTIAVDPEHCH